MADSKKKAEPTKKKRVFKSKREETRTSSERKVIKTRPKLEKELFDEEEVETTEAVDDTTPQQRKYPSPRNGKIFREIWNLYISDIATRVNFNQAHLKQLETLCVMYEEEARIEEFLRVNGFTYESVGRNGRQFKQYPEVALINTIRENIRKNLSFLGLSLSKESVGGDMSGNGGGEDGW